MSNLQIIEALCNLVEKQSTLIHRLSLEMENMQCLSDADRAEVADTRMTYSAILGADEAPDDLF